MSVLRKIPYIENLISTLTSDEVTTLKTVINSTGNDAIYSLKNNENLLRTHLTETRIECITLEFENSTKSGILIYKNNACNFLAYHRYPDMQIYSIDYENGVATQIYEDLTIEELRRCLLSASIGVESEWEQNIKEHLTYDGEEEQVEVGTDLEVDGTATINTELELGDSGLLGANLEAKIMDVALPSTEGNLNKILHVGTSGPSWVVNYSRGVDYYTTAGTTATGYLKFVVCTQAEYDALSTKDNETLYVVKGE